MLLSFSSLSFSLCLSCAFALTYHDMMNHNAQSRLLCKRLQRKGEGRRTERGAEKQWSQPAEPTARGPQRQELTSTGQRRQARSLHASSRSAVLVMQRFPLAACIRAKWNATHQMMLHVILSSQPEILSVSRAPFFRSRSNTCAL